MASASETRAREYYNPKGGGGARCWGSAVAKDAERQYWWSWRGIHVDPNAPLTNEELGELKDTLMGKDWSWRLTGNDATNTTNEGDDAAHIDASSAVVKDASEADRWIDAAATEWDVMTAPPAPPSSDLGIKETTEALIEAKSKRNDGEETVAGAAVASLLVVLMATLILGSWLKKRKVLWLHQAGAALLLGVCGGVYMISQAIAQDMRSKDGLGGEKNWILTYGDYLVFDTEFFFLFLLPPIIFESGYSIDAEPFFRNLGKISYFAFIGTFLGSFAFGLGMYLLGAIGVSHSFKFVDAMLFGSIMGATDPVTVLAIFADLRVDPDLFAVVFGESVLNDAVAVVLYRAIRTLEDAFTLQNVLHAVWAFVGAFLGSTAVGVGVALLSALLFKRVKLSGDGAHVLHPEAPNRSTTSSVGNTKGQTPSDASDLEPGVPATSADEHFAENVYRASHSSSSFDAKIKGATLEASVVALFPWIAYMLAEALELVGIVSILFCGIVMGHYTKRNLSEGGRALSSGAFALTAQLSETFVFIYCGASVFLAQPRFFVTAGWTVVLCLLSRALVVFPGVSMINRGGRRGASSVSRERLENEANAADGQRSETSWFFKKGDEKSGGVWDASETTTLSGHASSVKSAFTRLRGSLLGFFGGSSKTLKCFRFARVGCADAVFTLFGGGAPIPESHASMLWFSGLRGAMAFALAMEAAATRGEDGRAMLTSTLGAVLFTVLVVGGLTAAALRRLGVECDVDFSQRSVDQKPRRGRGGLFTARGGSTNGGTGVVVGAGLGGGPSDASKPNDADRDDADATAVLVRSEKDDGPAAKRGARRDRRDGGGNKTFGSFDEDDATLGPYGIDVRETFKFVDRQYITPMFTLEEGSRDAGNAAERHDGGERG
jgi:NhaP-type Na+/H+ or K+/H+ antiporter